MQKGEKGCYSAVQSKLFLLKTNTIKEFRLTLIKTDLEYNQIKIQFKKKGFHRCIGVDHFNFETPTH